MPTGVYVRTEKTRRTLSIANEGKRLSQWTRNKMAENMRRRKGSKHPAWKYGCYVTYHNLAWTRFGRAHCEMCGISLLVHYKKYKRRFHMHCYGDYRIMKEVNWITVCFKCHNKLDLFGKNAKMEGEKK